MTELFGKESAKAIQKMADAGQQFGGFFSRYFGGSVEQWAGLWEDKLRYRRWENQMKLMQKAEEKIQVNGLKGKMRPLSMKIGALLLEAASLEEDDYLRSLWVNLLVNSTRNDKNATHPSFIQILQNLLPEEAKLLEHAYTRLDAEGPIAKGKGVDCDYLLDKHKMLFAEKAGLSSYEEGEILAWFDNLVRLELVQIISSSETKYFDAGHHDYGDYGAYVETVHDKAIIFSAFGIRFMEAVEN